jgi:hypothetical protein
MLTPIKRTTPSVHNVLHHRQFVHTGKSPTGHPFDLPPLTVDRTAHPLPLMLHRSRSFLVLQSYFPNQEGDTFTAVELRRHRPRRWVLPLRRPPSLLQAGALNRVRRVHHELGKLAVYTLPRFGHRRAAVSRATTRALSALEVERALRVNAGRVLRSARPVVGRAA